MRNRRELLIVCFFLSANMLGYALMAKAQLLDGLFPEGVPGYGTQQGVTVQSRARPEFTPLGVRLGTVMIRPQLDMSIGYDDNLLAGSSHRGAWEVMTRPSILAGTETSAGSMGVYFSANDVRYLGASSQDRIDGTMFLGTTINIGRDKLTFGAGYLSQHEDRTALDALPSDQPVAFTVENLRVSYAADFGRLIVTPAFEFNRWRFDNTTVFGVPTSEASRDRTTAQGGVTLRFNWMPGRDLLWVNRVVNTHYDQPAIGVPSNNSTSWETLIGVDYDDDSVWRYRLLGGVQYRQAAAATIGSTAAGIAEAEVTWTPTGMTTLRAIASRGIEDAAQTGFSSYTYSSAQLVVDHEYLRNVLLTASATVRQASFNQTGGQQVGVSFGAGATWLIDRNLRLSLTYDFADVRNSHLPAGSVAGDYTRGLTLLTFRVGM